MAKTRKIRLLSPEELKKETINSGSQSGAGSGSGSGSDICYSSGSCANGSEFYCSGTGCDAKYKNIAGTLYLDRVSCSKDGQDTYVKICDNSLANSGSSAEAAKKACEKMQETNHCNWEDTKNGFSERRWGRCVSLNGHNDLICSDNKPY